jgi:hypothetical protein
MVSGIGTDAQDHGPVRLAAGRESEGLRATSILHEKLVAALALSPSASGLFNAVD